MQYTDKQKIEEAILDKFPESRKASNPVKKAVSGDQTLSEEEKNTRQTTMSKALG